MNVTLSYNFNIWVITMFSGGCWLGNEYHLMHSASVSEASHNDNVHQSIHLSGGGDGYYINQACHIYHHTSSLGKYLWNLPYT